MRFPTTTGHSPGNRGGDGDGDGDGRLFSLAVGGYFWDVDGMLEILRDVVVEVEGSSRGMECDE